MDVKRMAMKEFVGYPAEEVSNKEVEDHRKLKF